MYVCSHSWGTSQHKILQGKTHQVLCCLPYAMTWRKNSEILTFLDMLITFGPNKFLYLKPFWLRNLGRGEGKAYVAKRIVFFEVYNWVGSKVLTFFPQIVKSPRLTWTPTMWFSSHSVSYLNLSIKLCTLQNLMFLFPTLILKFVISCYRTVLRHI